MVNAFLKILVVDPIVKSKITEHVDKAYLKLKTGDVSIDFTCLREGPRFIETEEHERSAVPDLFRVVREGEKQGYDAIIVNCFGNPGLEESKRLVNVPVIGAGQSSFLKVKAGKKRFSVLTTVQEAVAGVKRNAVKYGVEELLASVRPVGMHVVELLQTERLRKALIGEGKKALVNDNAAIIVLGCTGMAGNAEWLSKRLDVPVIDPTRAAMEMAIKLIMQN